MQEVRLYWISGSLFQRIEIKSQIKDAISQYGQVETIVYSENFTAETIETEVLNQDLFDTQGKTKLFILKELPLFSTDSNKKWISLLSNIPTGRMVILDDISTSSRPTILKAVKSIGNVIDFPIYFKRNEIISMVTDTIKKEINKQIEYKDIELIIDSIGEESRKGYNIDRFYMAIEKLKLYIDPKKKKIEREDIYNVIPRRPEFIIWDLLRKMDQRSLPECIALYNKSVEQSDSSSAIESLLYTIIKKYTLLLFLKEELLLKRSDEDIIDKLKQVNSLKAEGSGSHRNFSIELTKENNTKSAYTDNVIRSALQGFYDSKPEVDLYTREELGDIIDCLNECFLKVRSGNCDDLEYRMLAENVFMTICGTFDNETLKSLRKRDHDTVI